MSGKQIRAVLICLSIALISNHAFAQKLRIMTTLTDFADIARQIGRDKVEVRSVMNGPESVHNVLATPTSMAYLNRADLFVHSGLDAEPWRDNLLKGARNPRVAPGKIGNVDMSIGIELLDTPTDLRGDRSKGDMHAFGNPHYTMNPANAQKMAATLVYHMAEVDPANADFYRENAVKFVEDVSRVDRELREKFSPYRGLKVVTFHQSLAYFAKAYDIVVVDTIEQKIGITPSPAEVEKVVRVMKENDVKIVLVETFNSYALAKSVADRAGAQLVVMPTQVNAVPEAASFQELLQTAIDRLIAAATAAGVAPRALR
jgi:zinc/manganese transport system substrate-binding protein